MNLLLSVVTAGVVATLSLGGAVAQESKIGVTSLETVLKSKPTQDAPARVVETFIANKSQLQVLTIKKIQLHHHEQEDHVVYVASGTGKGRVETTPGKIEERAVKPGDIFTLPKNLKHGFEAAAGQELVLLVVATVGWKPLEDTKFHE